MSLFANIFFTAGFGRTAGVCIFAALLITTAVLVSLRRRRHPERPLPGVPSLLALYPLFFTAVYLGHLTLLRLPYYWDEGGYYIPAALDFMRTGTLIPQSTITNAHPPMPSLLLAGAWHVTGFVPSGTRTFICMVAAAALLAVYRLARTWLGATPGAAVTLLTALYPVWYVQSTLAHADIFAAAFTLWALALYLPLLSTERQPNANPANAPTLALVAVLFALAVLSKETAIVIPFALSCERLLHLFRRNDKARTAAQLAACAFCVLPLLGWYAFHYHRTGFVFGNPEYLRYNATANMDIRRTFVSLYHRALHILAHMNMWVPTALTAACFLLPRRTHSAESRILPPAANRILLLLLATQWIAFSVLGGALLTRYLLPAFPMLLLLFVAVWQSRTRVWPLLTVVSAAAFVLALHHNPPYAFAPEDNLTYRDMIVLHQEAVGLIATRYPQATVLSAWPAAAELQNTFLGYTPIPIKTVAIQNFSIDELMKANQQPGDFDTALLFSTKYEPPAGRTDLSAPTHNVDARYFDFHHDLSPEAAARLLGGTVVWKDARNGEWAAVLRFPRSFNAALEHPTPWHQLANGS